MITSPRTSSTPGASAWPSALSRSGMVRMVRRLAVTSSPAMPSPRVVPRVNRPSSKRRLIATPSALGSTSHSSGSPGRSFCTRYNKVAHLLLRVGVVEAHHRHRMPNGLEAVDRRAADALTGRVGGLEFRMRQFEVEQLAVKLVVLLVADRRLCLDIIRPVMPANLLRQHRMPLL